MFWCGECGFILSLELRVPLCPATHIHTGTTPDCFYHSTSNLSGLRPGSNSLSYHPPHPETNFAVSLRFSGGGRLGGPAPPQANHGAPSVSGARVDGGRQGAGLEGVSSPAGCMLRGLTQLENLASFYHIYHFAIYGQRELLAARLGPRWWAPRVK